MPKRTLKEDGTAGPANGVSCGSIEEKMGIHGSATCVMHFDEAEGYLIGKPHKGLRCMFTMMNGARLGVGLQGLGLGETAYQSAAAYAMDRRQGRGLKGAEEPDAFADPIIVHPDVRRMLLTQRAINEGARALAYWTALQLDISRSHEDASVREDADELVQLMTPIIKAFFTDYGFEATNLALQVHGGHGYIREHGNGASSCATRGISQIYEGANGIQALDLVGAQAAPAAPARYLRHFFHPAVAFVRGEQGRPGACRHRRPRRQGPRQAADRDARRRPARAWAIRRRPVRRRRTTCGCSGWWPSATCGARWRSCARDKQNGDAFYDTKLKTARFYVQKVLPDTAGLFLKIMAGKGTVMAHGAEEF